MRNGKNGYHQEDTRRGITSILCLAVRWCPVPCMIPALISSEKSGLVSSVLRSGQLGKRFTGLPCSWDEGTSNQLFS